MDYDLGYFENPFGPEVLPLCPGWTQEIWSREWELNPRPADYESAALPLSYLGSNNYHSIR